MAGGHRRRGAGPDHRAVAEHGHVGAADHGPGPVERQRRGQAAGGVHVGPVPVPPLGLEEDHRVVAADRELDHRVGVGGVAAGHHAQPGGVREQRLGGLAVVLDRADAAAARDPDHHRQAEVAERAEPHLGQLGGDLVEGREHEAVELDLAHRAVAAQGQPDRGADDAGLGQRGVHDPGLAEVLLQPVGDPEDPAELPDVLAHDQDLRVALQGLAQPLVQGLGQGEPGHRAGLLERLEVGGVLVALRLQQRARLGVDVVEHAQRTAGRASRGTPS